MDDDLARDPDTDEAAALVARLEDALRREPLSVEVPPLAPPPASRAGRALRALALLGGVASARAVAAQLDEPGLTARQVREALRGGAVRRLGGGYLALPAAVDPPLEPWLRGRLRRLGPRRVEELVQDVLRRWPHGDPEAVASWLRADPPGVVVVDDVARLVPGWEERGGEG